MLHQTVANTMCILVYFDFISSLNSCSWLYTSTLRGDTILSTSHTQMHAHPGGRLPAGFSELWQRAHPRGHSKVCERRAPQWPRVQPWICTTEILSCCRPLCLGNQHHTLPWGTAAVIHGYCHRREACVWCLSLHRPVFLSFDQLFSFHNYSAALDRFL